MSDFSAILPSVNLLKPATKNPTLAVPMTADEKAKREAIHKTATEYEASFLSQMMSHMFEGVTTSAPFGGGEGEEAYKSFLIEAYAKQVAKAGGVGVTASVQREMLKMQGLH